MTKKQFLLASLLALTTASSVYSRSVDVNNTFDSLVSYPTQKADALFMKKEQELKDKIFKKHTPAKEELANKIELVDPTFDATPLSPLVMTEGSKNKTSQSFDFVRNTLINMNDLEYHLAKIQSTSDDLNKVVALFNKETNRKQKAKLAKKIEKLEKKIKNKADASKEHFQSLENQGWEFTVFEGETGSLEKETVKDDRGFVAYHAESNKFAVIFHGSRCGKDWDANFDSSKVEDRSIGLNLNGAKLHRGFGHAVASSIKGYTDILRRYKDKITSKTEIFVSGHSQGAAVAQVALAELTNNFGKEVYGSNFDNKVRNNFKGFVLSAPRTFAKESCGIIEDIVGKDNIIRQNVWGDLVPQTGFKRVNGFVKSVINGIDATSQFIDTWITKKYNPLRAITHGFAKGSLAKHIEDSTGYRTVGHLALDYSSDVMERKGWDDVKQAWNKGDYVGILKTLAAPMHYGSTSRGGCAFDPDMVGKDTNAMLNQGSSWTKTKKAHKQKEGEKMSIWTKMTSPKKTEKVASAPKETTKNKSFFGKVKSFFWG